MRIVPKKTDNLNEVVIEIDDTPKHASDPEIDYNNRELEEASKLVSDLLRENWNGILQTVHETPEAKTSVSLVLYLNHSAPAGRYVKAKLAYSVKTKSETQEVFVGDPSQPEMF
jgi:hypothetical protein